MRPLILSLIVCALLLPSPAVASGPLRYAGATTLQRHFMPEAAQAFEAQTGIAGGDLAKCIHFVLSAAGQELMARGFYRVKPRYSR